MPYNERELTLAISAGQFRLLYQPLIAPHSRHVMGVEALVRWQHPDRGLLGPAGFLPAMERNHLMAGLTDWTIEEAARTHARWRVAGVNIAMSVNLSATLLQDAQFVQRVLDILAHEQMPPHLLTLEVTETALAQHPSAAANIFSRLRRTGIHVAVDDFGTGYTSLAMLKDYTFDEIKIDRSFVAAMRHSPADAAIVRSVLELGHRLGLQVVAEGIEDGATARLLEDLGCDVLQGFYFAKPCTEEDALETMHRHGTSANEISGVTAAAPTTAQPLSAGRTSAPLPPDEDSRLAALAALQVLDTAPEEILDDLVAIAAAICGTPKALLTFIDRERQWFKSKIGVLANETPREEALCSYAILTPDEITEVPDTLLDERFRDNPLVAGEPHIRFYASAPLVTDEGHAVGTLCVVDSSVHSLDDQQRSSLRKLAKLAMRYLEVRLTEAFMQRLQRVVGSLSKMHMIQDIPDAASIVASAAREILHADGANLMLADHPGAVHYRASGIATSRPEDAGEAVRVIIDSRLDVATATVVQTRQPLFIADAVRSGQIPTELIEKFRVASVLYLPLLGETSVMGVIVVWWTKPQESLPQVSMTAATILADEAANTLARLNALTALRQAAETDPLTGLLNRRAFAGGVNRLPPDSAIVIFDLDYFKHVNDAGGHQAGDQVLKSFSAHLRAAARSEDLVARWGGEEFAVALPAGGLDGARSLLGRLRES